MENEIQQDLARCLNFTYSVTNVCVFVVRLFTGVIIELEAIRGEEKGFCHNTVKARNKTPSGTVCKGPKAICTVSHAVPRYIHGG